MTKANFKSISKTEATFISNLFGIEYTTKAAFLKALTAEQLTEGHEKYQAAEAEKAEAKAKAAELLAEKAEEPAPEKPEKTGKGKGKGKGLTFEELQELAKANYEKGGDIVVECWDVKMYNSYVEQFGPLSKKKALEFFKLNKSMDDEAKAAAAWYSGETTEESKPEAEPEELPAVCAIHSTYKRPQMLAVFAYLDDAGIAYKADKKGRVTTELAVFRYRKGGVMVQGKGKFRKAHPEIEWDYHEGWDIPYCLDFAIAGIAVEFIYPETAIQEPAENAEAPVEEAK